MMRSLRNEKRYCIRHTYRPRRGYVHYDDAGQEDQWQLEVYLHALGLMVRHGLRSVLDVGCGSGYKLVTYFRDYETVGLELPENVELLRRKYPDRKWVESDFTQGERFGADCAICSDVIEHLEDPDVLMAFLKSVRFRFLILSTPARNVLYRPWQRGYWGPPRNLAHQREWGFDEFGKYVSASFDVLDHRVTNLSQATQMVICQHKTSS